jgi:hypothetical protein
LIKFEFLNDPERVRKPQAVMGAMTVRPTDGVTCNMVSKQCQIQHFLVPKKILQGITPYLDKIRISEWPWASTQTPSSDGRDRWSDLQHGEQAMLDTAFSGNQKKFCKGLPPTLIKFKFLNAPGPIFNCLQANPEQWCSELHQQQ